MGTNYNDNKQMKFEYFAKRKQQFLQICVPTFFEDRYLHMWKLLLSICETFEFHLIFIIVICVWSDRLFFQF